MDQRQDENERGLTLPSRIEEKVPAVSAGDGAREGQAQPEPGSALHRLGVPKKRLKESLGDFNRRRASVDDGDTHVGLRA